MIIIHNEDEMRELGDKLAESIKAGDCLALHGDLGAGKSFLARAIMRALGVIDSALPSPTFAIIQEYDAANYLRVAHMDWYRLENGDEVENLGIQEFFAPPWVTLIEWSERASYLLPPQTRHIHIEIPQDNFKHRHVHIKSQD